MQDFLNQIESTLVNFPPLLKSIIIAGLGALSASIVLSLFSEKPVTTRRMLGQLFVGWMTGIFGGSLVSNAFASQSMSNYVSGLGGFLAARKYLNGKETENKDESKPPETGQNV
ncbi:hypothetical protein [Spirosoma flavum]|uniref:Holin n=1 Tax=Spirosoma flavum TaxID=2048557 RepID=A0ABW6APH7_9BACT